MGKLVHEEQMSGAKDRVYLEIELEPETSTKLEALSEKHGVMPFEMCVALLREAVAARNDLSE